MAAVLNVVVLVVVVVAVIVVAAPVIGVVSGRGVGVAVV